MEAESFLLGDLLSPPKEEASVGEGVVAPGSGMDLEGPSEGEVRGEKNEEEEWEAPWHEAVVVDEDPEAHGGSTPGTKAQFLMRGTMELTPLWK